MSDLIGGIRPVAIGRWRIAALAIVLCWLASLALPVARMADGFQPRGFGLLIGGWMALGEGQPAWLGNLILCWLLLLVGARSDARPLSFRITGAALLVCGAAAWGWRELPDEVSPIAVEAFGPGFYIWMLAIWGGAVAAMARSFATERI